VVVGTSDAQVALARYNADGIPDPSFGSDGKQTTGFVNGVAAYGFGVALQDGKIVVAGCSEEYMASEFVPFPPSTSHPRSYWLYTDTPVDNERVATMFREHGFEAGFRIAWPPRLCRSSVRGRLW
jgi:hypothetical protein